MINNIKSLPESYYGFIYHYYRGEVYRETSWRNRLDTTTNWSIVVTAAILTFSFSDNQSHHIVILANYILVWFFLYIESRRFRYYTLLRERTRLIEREILTHVFKGEALKNNHDKWRKKIVDSLNNMKVPIGRLESIAYRIRRNYIILFPLIFVSWVVKAATDPFEARSLSEFFDQARVFHIPGEIVFLLMVFSILYALGISYYLPQFAHEDDLP